MQKLVLYIGNETVYDQDNRVELFKDENVEFTQTIQNIRDIKKIFTEFSKTFSVPATKRNNKIFQHYYNYDIRNGYDARLKTNASLELNDLPFKRGKIALTGVDLKNNVPHTYKITFFGNTVNLKDILGDYQLSSLSSLGNYDLIYNHSTIENALENGIGNSNEIIAPLITHTDRLIYDSVKATSQTNNLFYSSGLGYEANGLDLFQLKFAIKLRMIVEAIEADFPTITFSNDFFNSNNPDYETLYMWLHRKKGSVKPASEEDLVWTSITDIRQTDVVPVGALNPTVNVNNGNLILTSDPDVEYTQTSLIVTPSNNLSYSIRVYQYSSVGASVVAQLSNVTGVQDVIAQGEILPTGTYGIEVASSEGTIVFAADSMVWTVGINYSIGFLTSPVVYTIKNRIGLVSSASVEFSIQQQIPKMTIISFLTSLFQMFNLTAYVDDEDIIVIKTLDSYYSTFETYNINEYLDVSKSQVNLALPYKSVSFSYKGLGTFLAKKYEQLFSSGWGSENYALDNEIFDVQGERYQIEIPFEHMQFERLFNQASTGGITTIMYGYFVDDNQEPYIGDPLIFYGIKQLSGVATNRIAIRDANDNLDSVGSYFIPSNSVSVIPNNKSNINFSNEVNEYTLTTDFTNTLFKDYYSSYIKDTFNRQRRLTKVTAYLPYKIFANLQLNDLIELGQDDYRINSLKTNLTTGKTEFELLNIVK